MQHTEEMAWIQNKWLKLQLKMLQAQNEATTLACTSSLTTVSSATSSTSSLYLYHSHNLSPATTYQTHPFQQSKAGPSRITELSSLAAPELPLSFAFPGGGGEYNFQSSNPDSVSFLTGSQEYDMSGFPA